MRSILWLLVGSVAGASAVFLLAPAGRKTLRHARNLAEGKAIHYRHRLANAIEGKATHLTNVALGRSRQLAEVLRG